MKSIIVFLNDIVWGVPALCLILGVGIYLSVRLGFAQLTLFPEALRHFVRQFFPGRNHDRSSSFRALCTALGATVGTGNIVGVAGAVSLGGPGAVFWIWVCGLFGMIIKFAEAVLAVRCRIKTAEGYAGGPMYIITRNLPRRFHWLAFVYAIFGVAASFGVGNAAQINAAISGIHEACSVLNCSPGRIFDLLLTGLFALVIGIFLFGGAKRIYSAAEQLVPFAAAAYLLLCAWVLWLKWRELPSVFFRIFQGAFSPKAVTGGIIGSAFQTLRIGSSRGVFTNEAGMGTASIAHADAEGVHPVQQGLMGIMEVFLDTIVICTLTALTLLTSVQSGLPIEWGKEAGSEMISASFSMVFGNQVGSLIIATGITLFALSTILSWALYGTRACEFLLGHKCVVAYQVVFVALIVIGATLDLDLVWTLAEALNGFMAIPNLIALLGLSGVVIKLTKEYFSQPVLK